MTAAKSDADKIAESLGQLESAVKGFTKALGTFPDAKVIQLADSVSAIEAKLASTTTPSGDPELVEQVKRLAARLEKKEMSNGVLQDSAEFIQAHPVLGTTMLALGATGAVITATSVYNYAADRLWRQPAAPVATVVPMEAATGRR